MNPSLGNYKSQSFQFRAFMVQPFNKDCVAETSSDRAKAEIGISSRKVGIERESVDILSPDLIFHTTLIKYSVSTYSVAWPFDCGCSTMSHSSPTLDLSRQKLLVYVSSERRIIQVPHIFLTGSQTVRYPSKFICFQNNR